MLKNMVGVGVGLVVALAAIYVIWLVGLNVYPLPPEASQESLEGLGARIEFMPIGAQIFIFGSWLGGAFAGALTAALISRRLWPTWVVAAWVALISLGNVVMFPAPEWMQVGAIVAPVLGTLLAVHRARRSLLADRGALTADA